ncbi:MAG: TldD/PmbA family protein [bacterium]|nr:TldD/PmbA family protein [bacterium]
MLGENKLKEIAKKALAQSPAEATQINIWAWDSGLTRFATSYIHQNVSEENISLSAQCVNNKKIGTANTNSLDKIDGTISKANEISKLCPPNPEWPGFATPLPIAEANTFIPETQKFTPEERAKGCKTIIDRATTEEKDLQAYGSFVSGTMEGCIANSNGLFVYNKATSATISTTIIGKSGTGYAAAGSRDVRQINYNNVAEIAVKKAVLSQNPVKIEPGKYEVILEPLAVVELLEFLSWLGFNALSYQEGRSPFSGKLGQKLMGDNITIWDDGLDTKGFPFPFDSEGTPVQKVMLVENGVVKNMVYDLRSAKKEGKTSTGHSSGNSAYGASPSNLFMKGDNNTLETIVSKSSKAILVTRFWYTNIIDPMTVALTGMTRDGTYLIENGKVTKSLKNLRFTQSVIEALSQVTELSKALPIPGSMNYGVPYLNGSVVPALKIKDWNFTGVSEH